MARDLYYFPESRTAVPLRTFPEQPIAAEIQRLDMNIDARPRLAFPYPGDRAARERADPAESRFLKVFDAFASAGMAAEPAIYQDDFRDEVL